MAPKETIEMKNYLQLFPVIILYFLRCLGISHLGINKFLNLGVSKIFYFLNHLLYRQYIHYILGNLYSSRSKICNVLRKITQNLTKEKENTRENFFSKLLSTVL